VVASCVIGVVAFSLPVVAFALLRVIEPPPLNEKMLASAQAIVILGGGRSRTAPEWGGVTVNAFTLQRVRYGAHLARVTSLPVMVSGGAPEDGGVSEADLMRGILRDEFGVTARWADTASFNTRENARFAAQELAPAGIKRIALVTDAWHAERAAIEFRRNGLDVVLAPTGMLGTRPFSFYQLVPNVESLRYAHIALREMLGVVWYQLTS
jgi:uncharacterized SAM-binding protein YcdF (DUF218 family)